MNRLALSLVCAWLALTPFAAQAAEPSACAILAAHDGWAEDVRAASDRWSVPPALLLGVIRQESNFRPDKRNPNTTSPYGYPQAIKATWTSYVESAGEPDARRNDFAASVDFIGWYLSGTKERTGLAYKNVVAHYLHYSRGPAPVGAASRATRRNAAHVAAFAEAYEKDLRACPLPHPTALPMADLGG